MTFFNVARWSVFTGGIVYGFLHNRTLVHEAAEYRESAAFKKQEKLIKEAKAEWLKLHPKPAPSTDGPVTDLDSPEFDPVKVIDWSIKNLEKA